MRPEPYIRPEELCRNSGRLPVLVRRTVSRNGTDTVYAAASNSAGYAANPVSRTIKIDTGKPTVKCVASPTFILRGKGGLVSATVRDSTSGPRPR